VFDRLEQFSGDEMQFRSWLFTIAYRILVDDARRRQRRPKTVALAPLVDSVPAGDVEREALANVGSEWADSMLQSLPPDQRAVLAVRVTADLPLEQVAQILDMRVGAVKALQHRALASPDDVARCSQNDAQVPSSSSTGTPPQRPRRAARHAWAQDGPVPPTTTAVRS
jgi:RNA polymerase sigma-70 factor (ECF subfamily)